MAVAPYLIVCETYRIGEAKETASCSSDCLSGLAYNS